MTKTEALKLALEALEHQLMQAGGETGCDHEIGICFCLEAKAITAIKEALAQPEQEPNGYVQTVIEALYEGTMAHYTPRIFDDYGNKIV